MANSESKDKKSKGFAGLDSMVSDISADVEEASKSGPLKTASPLVDESSRSATPQPTGRTANISTSQPPDSEKNGLLVVGVIIIGAIIFVSLIVNSGSKPPSEPYSAPTSYSSQTPVYAPADLPVPVEATFDISMPPVGKNQVLEVPQIRYCKIEKIRIDAFDSVINTHNKNEVNHLDNFISDYKSRCRAFRYRRGDRELAQKGIDPMMKSIAYAARNEWLRDALDLKD